MKINSNNQAKEVPMSLPPFTIHGSSIDAPHQYCTHTHGLAKLGWPEFFMNPLAFGGEQNAARIYAAYEYFKRPETDD